MWTSAQTVNGKTQFCSMINHILREDLARGVEYVVIFTRLLNRRFIVKIYPRDQLNGIFPISKCLWRGGGLPEKHHSFFAQRDKWFRVPGFLASSRNKEVAIRFMKRQKETPVLWMILLCGFADQGYREFCRHLSYVEKSHFRKSEEEFLFPPYSAFQVVRMQRETTEMAQHLLIIVRFCRSYNFICI